jgi:hypothetical protein
MYKLYSVMDKTETCDTPALTSLGVYILPSTETLNFHSERNLLINLIRFLENSIVDNLYNKSGFHKVSKAFSMSRNTVAVDILLLKLRVIWSVSLIH